MNGNEKALDFVAPCLLLGSVCAFVCFGNPFRSFSPFTRAIVEKAVFLLLLLLLLSSPEELRLGMRERLKVFLAFSFSVLLLHL